MFTRTRKFHHSSIRTSILGLGIFLCLAAVPVHVHAQGRGWTVQATDTNKYVAAYLGNGVVGFRSLKNGLGAERVVMNGLYDRTPSGDYARLINSYNPINVKIFFNGNEELRLENGFTGWRQTMNLKEATLETDYTYDTRLRVNTQLVALRNLPTATLAVYNLEAVEDVAFTIQNTLNLPDRRNAPGLYKTVLQYNQYSLSTMVKEKIPVLSGQFPTESGSDCVAGANTFYFDGPAPKLTYNKASEWSGQLRFDVKLKKGEKYSFAMLSAFTHSKLTADPYSDAVCICSRDYNLGYRHLLQGHKAAWAKLWQSDIGIEGDDEAQMDARLALYSLYASATAGFDWSIPPCGLAETGWGGHIFWDAELWMYPTMLVMQPAMASSMMAFRVNTLPQAKRRAAQFGFAGAMYPWESDLDGNECTPIAYKLDINEHHITADVAIAAWNYYRVTKDKQWLQQKGYPLIKEVADFWLSRVTKDEKGKYGVKNVIGPDEYHEDVNDDAFTNGAVAVVMDAANKSAKLVGAVPNPAWLEVEKNILVLQATEGHTLQHATYKGERIKQADVNLLAFPLDYMTDPAQIQKDLQYYEPKIDPNGPSMSYCVLATSYARLGQTRKAYELFQKAYQPNRKPPFGFISEKPRPSGTVFCTGYGGMLQTILFGFAGLTIDDTGLRAGKPNLPPHWKKLTVKMAGKKDLVCLPAAASAMRGSRK